MNKMLLLIMAFIVHGEAQGADTEYSNSQSGVRMKVLNIDTDDPTLRIENYGSLTLAIRNDVTLGVSFYKDGQRVFGRSDTGLALNGVRKANSNQIAIIGPGAALEVPLRMMYLKMYEDGADRDNWTSLKIRLHPDRYVVKFTSNANGISVLDANFSPFNVNFDIPEFEHVVSE